VESKLTVETRLPAQAPQLAVALYSYRIGGSERIGAELARGYRRRGYRVFCFAFHDSNGPIREYLEKSGIECLDLNYLARPRGVRRRIRYQVELARLLRRRRVAAFHMHHMTALILCGFAARVARVRTIMMTEHAIHELEADRSFRRAARFYCKLAHEVTVVHPGLVDYFTRELRVRRERVHYVPNGVAIPEMSQRVETRARVRARYAVASESFVFLFAGRLHPTKDLPTLLAAVKIVAAARSCSLWLVGDGPERATLEALSREEGLTEVVRFCGATSDIAPFLAAADAFVMSSATEGLPMVLLEAMASRLPCIATAVGGIPGLLGQGVGLLVPPRDPPALAAAMRRLMGEEALRSQMSSLGLQKVAREYDFERVVDQYLDLLRLPRRWTDAAPGRSA
jgi:glycosyltransferase involved in cell wall biosynthesis